MNALAHCLNGLSHRVLVRLGLDEVGGPTIWLRLFSVYRAILHQGQRGGEERVAMPPVTDPGPLSNQSQWRTNESPGPLALQKTEIGKSRTETTRRNSRFSAREEN